MKEGWEYKKLGEVCEITMGQSPDSKSYNKDGRGLPFFQGCADFGILNPNISTYCSEPKKVAEPLDILMSVRAPVGTLNIANTKCCIGRGLASFREIKNKSSYKFLYYLLKSSEKYFQDNSTGATFKAIGKELVVNYKIKIPSIYKQIEISSELDLLSGVIEKQKAQLEELDKLAQSIFYDMFGDPVTNEKGWRKYKMNDLCEYIVDCPHSTPIKSKSITKYPCIRTSELKGGSISWDSMQYLEKDEYEKRITRLKPIAGDIVFGREGTIGDAVVLPEGYFFSLGQRTMLLRAKNELISNIYLHKTLMSEWIRKQISNVNVSSTVAHVNIKDFKCFDVPLPPLSLQQEFAAKVEAIEAMKTKVRQSLKEAETLFNERMNCYFG